MSVATTLKRCKGGQFAIHAKALPGNPVRRSSRSRSFRSPSRPDAHLFEVLHSQDG
jgi:hypothetical protein